jgi:hypothetical protein
MNDTIRQDILNTLIQVIKILDSKEDRDFSDIKNLSNQVIHNASIYQDQDSITIAVIIYSISKIFERTSEIDPKLKSHMEHMIHFLEENNDSNFHKAVRNTMLHISRLDQKVGLYIEQVVQQARIKKGSKIYEHGISIAQSADLLGISQWQLMDYIGKTTIIDATPGIQDVKKRLDFARSLFR